MIDFDPALIKSCTLLEQISSVTDHVGVQDGGPNTADFDDDDGGGLVSKCAQLFSSSVCYINMRAKLRLVS